MSLDWIATPHPDAPHVEGESSDDYEKDPVFPVHRIRDQGLLVHVETQIVEDMTYWQAETLASTLEVIIADHEDSDAVTLHDITDDSIPELEKAVEWLRYWSGEQKSVYVMY